MKTLKNRDTLSETQIDHLTCLFQGNFALIVEAANRYALISGQLDDIVQRTYIEFVQGVAESKWDSAKWEHEGDVGPLLYQIAKRMAQTVRRECLRNQRHISIDLVTESLVGAYEVDETESMNDKKVKIERLKHCLGQLSPTSRSIVEQHYFGGVTMKELARQHGKKDSAIYNFFFHIRAKLRNCIEKGLKQDE